MTTWKTISPQQIWKICDTGTMTRFLQAGLCTICVAVKEKMARRAKLADLENELQDEISPESFLSGFKLAPGIAADFAFSCSFHDDEPRGSEAPQGPAGALQRRVHPPDLRPHHTTKAERSRPGHGKSHGTGTVKTFGNKQRTGRELPAGALRFPRGACRDFGVPQIRNFSQKKRPENGWFRGVLVKMLQCGSLTREYHAPQRFRAARSGTDSGITQQGSRSRLGSAPLAFFRNANQFYSAAGSTQHWKGATDLSSYTASWGLWLMTIRTRPSPVPRQITSTPAAEASRGRFC